MSERCNVCDTPIRTVKIGRSCTPESIDDRNSCKKFNMCNVQDVPRL